MFTKVDDGTFVLGPIDERVAAQDYPTALRMLARHWPTLVTTQGASVRAVVRGIPESEWAQDAAVHAAMGASFCAADGTQAVAALPWLDAAERLSDSPALICDILLHRSSALRALGRLADAGVAATAAVERLDGGLGGGIDATPGALMTLRARAAAQTGMIALHSGRYDDAARELSLAVGLDSELAPAELVECRSALMLLSCLSGDSVRCEEHATVARRIAGDGELLHGRHAAGLHIAEAFTAVLQLRLAESVESNPVLGALCRFEEWQPLARLAQASVSFVNGRGIEALELVRKASSSLRLWQARPAALSLCDELRATILTQLGELDTAAEAAKGVEQGDGHELCHGRLVAAIKLRRGDPRGALAALRGCEALGGGHSVRTLLDVLLISAAARHELGTAARGDLDVDRALQIAAGSGIRLPFMTLPNPLLRRVLSRAADRKQSSAVHSLLDELRSDAERDTSPDELIPIAPALEPLSERELELLAQLALDRTLGEIAAELFISSNTVKSHVRSIYRKLGVNSRSDAVRRAQEQALSAEITRA